MRKHNYFDDDQDDIQSIISSFDAPRNIKKQEVENSLKEIEKTHRAAKSEKTEAKMQKETVEKAESHKGGKNHGRKTAVLDSIKTISKDNGKKIAAIARSIKEKGLSEEIDHLSKKKRAKVTIGLFVVFILFLVFLVGLTVHSVKSENERIQKFNSDAGKVCAQYIAKYGNCSYENLYPMYGVSGYRMTGLCFAREIDFDNDNISELILCYDEGGVYFTEVWGYNHDKDFVKFYSEEATQTERKRDDVWTTLYVKNNKCYIGKHSGDKNENVELYELDGSSFKKTKMTAKFANDGANYSIDGENNAPNFERVRLSVLSEEKAALTAERTSALVEGYLGSTSTSDLVASANNIKSAYYSVVLDYNQTYGKAELVKSSSSAYIDGLAVVDLIDFNGDGTDELLVIYRKPVKVRDSDANGNYISKVQDKYYIEIYRYNGTKAILSYKNESISNSLSDDVDRYYIIKKQNNRAYYCFNAFSSQEYGRVINASSTVYKFSKGKFVQQTKASYISNYGYNEYYIDEQQVYQSTFEEKGYTVPLFDGKSSYDEDKYSVTYLQRKRLKADKLDQRVEDTINNIKKLNSSYSGALE
ncbi:MAG: hypothetical protein IJR70_04055 [Eubacterium sp.]|nr:hypothetical protein [Eubacterium sp.]